MSHTPGPWNVIYYLEGGYDTLSSAYRVQDVENSRICDVDTRDYSDCVPNPPEDKWTNCETSETAQANAHLIAAAPELLKACCVALDHLDVSTGDAVDLLTRAIAKAEGTQP